MIAICSERAEACSKEVWNISKNFNYMYTLCVYSPVHSNKKAVQVHTYSIYHRYDTCTSVRALFIFGMMGIVRLAFHWKKPEREPRQFGPYSSVCVLCVSLLFCFRLKPHSLYCTHFSEPDYHEPPYFLFFPFPFARLWTHVLCNGDRPN